jgi:amino acid transporter
MDAGEDMKNKIGSIAWLLSLLVGFVVFSGWLSMVGNPHVAETMIGLVLAVVSCLVVYFKLSRWSKGV